MTACKVNTASCDQVDVMPVRIGLRRDLTLMCSGCRRSASVVVTIVERRGATVPVEAERRRFVPAWLRHLHARDLTGWIA